MTETLTLRFEIHKGDVTDQFLWPLGQTALIEVVQVGFGHGEWTVSGKAGDVPFLGRGEYKNDAILNCLRARLGISGESKEEVPLD